VTLEDLANEIERRENQIGLGTKILAWIKSWFGGDSYDVAIARQAFSKIESNTQQTFLKLTFQAAMSPNQGEVQLSNWR
ncbi:MAG: hypothetical protein LBD34_01475, partial [Puniceicoccales bacterium]|nr:hypothetical protein [Puniceicoccales bacterium]